MLAIIFPTVSNEFPKSISKVGYTLKVIKSLIFSGPIFKSDKGNDNPICKKKCPYVLIFLVSTEDPLLYATSNS